MKAAATGIAGASGNPEQAGKVAGSSGGPDKKGDVAGANGGPGKKDKSDKKVKDATQVGGAADAAKGADKVSGGGGSDLKSALDGLMAAVKSLADAVSTMGTTGGGCDAKGAGHVAGVRGGAATRSQYVARAGRAERADNSGEDDPFEAKVLELINKERQRAGLAPVRYNGLLDNAAEKHARHMGIVRKMAHDGIGDGDPGERVRAEGFRRGWGENVATGQRSPEQVVREWMNSPSHRRNILDPNFRQMGVGQVTGSDGRSYWAQNFGR